MKWDHKDRKADGKKKQKDRTGKVFGLLSNTVMWPQGRQCPQYDTARTPKDAYVTLPFLSMHIHSSSHSNYHRVLRGNYEEKLSILKIFPTYMSFFYCNGLL